jgi:D-beta-D-heptose 7-phosphate kinase/D-beta-D-heptose 1-phosphate adenosyltransferase
MLRLKKIVNRFPKARILVVGDLILDEYVWGKAERLSPEAPVPVVWADSLTHVPGGAANVANNIRALDGKVSLVGLLGDDDKAGLLRKELSARGIDISGLSVQKGRHTTVKTRVIAGHQQIVRVDWEHTDPLPQEAVRRIFNHIKSRLNDFDAIVIEDYGKGVINMQLLQGLVMLARENNKIVTVDPKEDHFQYYRGVSAITPNRKELANAVRNLKIKDTRNLFRVTDDRLLTQKDIDGAADQIMQYLELEALLLTMGENGMKLFQRNGEAVHIPTVAQEVFDVSGAGDTVIGTFTLALCAGATKLEAAHIANHAAGIVVGKIGTATTSRKELLERLS